VWYPPVSWQCVCARACALCAVFHRQPYAADLSPSNTVLDVVGRLEEVLHVLQKSMIPKAEREATASPVGDVVLDLFVCLFACLFVVCWFVCLLVCLCWGAPSYFHSPRLHVCVRAQHKIVASFTDPLLRMCRLSAEGLDTSDTCVYMINNIAAMQSSLIPFAFTSAWVKRLSLELERWEEALVSEQTRRILSDCAISSKLGAIATHSPAVRRSVPTTCGHVCVVGCPLRKILV